MILHKKSDRKKEQGAPIIFVLSRKQCGQISAQKKNRYFYVVKFLALLIKDFKHRNVKIGRKFLILCSPLTLPLERRLTVN